MKGVRLLIFCFLTFSIGFSGLQPFPNLIYLTTDCFFFFCASNLVADQKIAVRLIFVTPLCNSN